MPELADVARVVHFIRKELVGKTITKVNAQHDDNVFGKVGTTAAEFQKKILDKKIVGTGQQGKYFWIAMSSPPHPVMHFGMTGWLKIKGVDSQYHLEKTSADESWPPKFWKFMLEANGGSKTEAAFVDARRLGRVRLVDCPADDIRNYSPLKENGPDPVADKNVVTETWLRDKLRRKKVPIKALLLDQTQISGLGNWMTDEVLYHAQIHPEQYSNTLQDAQIRALHSAIHYVCATSVDLLGDDSQFPDDWLFPHRWNKGKKTASQRLPNGDKIEFVTVGGRTSAIVPSVQKPGGLQSKNPVSGGLDGGEDEAEGKTTAKATARKRKATETAPQKPAAEAKTTTAKKPKAEADTPLRRGRSAGRK